jgi:hypothetical protein
MWKKKGLNDTLHTCQDNHLKELLTHCRRASRSELKKMVERLLLAMQHDPAIRRFLRNATLNGGKLLVKVSNREDFIYPTHIRSLSGDMQSENISYALFVSTSLFSESIGPDKLPAHQVIQTINGPQLAKYLNIYSDHIHPNNPIPSIVFQKHSLEIIFLP